MEEEPGPSVNPDPKEVLASFDNKEEFDEWWKTYNIVTNQSTNRNTKKWIRKKRQFNRTREKKQALQDAEEKTDVDTYNNKENNDSLYVIYGKTTGKVIVLLKKSSKPLSQVSNPTSKLKTIKKPKKISTKQDSNKLTDEEKSKIEKMYREELACANRVGRAVDFGIPRIYEELLQQFKEKHPNIKKHKTQISNFVNRLKTKLHDDPTLKEYFNELVKKDPEDENKIYVVDKGGNKQDGYWWVWSSKRRQKIQMDSPILMTTAYRPIGSKMAFLLVASGACDEDLYNDTYFGFTNKRRCINNFFDVVSQNKSYFPKFVETPPFSWFHNAARKYFPESNFLIRWYNNGSPTKRAINYVYDINSEKKNDQPFAFSNIAPVGQCERVLQTLVKRSKTSTGPQFYSNIIQHAFGAEWIQYMDAWEITNHFATIETKTDKIVGCLKRPAQLGLAFNEFPTDDLGSLEIIEKLKDRLSELKLNVEAHPELPVTNLNLNRLELEQLNNFGDLQKFLYQQKVKHLVASTVKNDFFEGMEQSNEPFLSETLEYLEFSHVFYWTDWRFLAQDYNCLLSMFPNLKELKVSVQYWCDTGPLFPSDEYFGSMGIQIREAVKFKDMFLSIPNIRLDIESPLILSSVYRDTISQKIVEMVSKCEGFEHVNEECVKNENDIVEGLIKVMDVEFTDNNFTCHFNVTINFYDEKEEDDFERRELSPQPGPSNVTQALNNEMQNEEELVLERRMSMSSVESLDNDVYQNEESSPE